MAKETFFSKISNAIVTSFFTKAEGDGANKKAVAFSPNYNTSGNYLDSIASMKDKGLRKPGKITFNHLRKLASYDALIRICVNVIKKEVSQADWSITTEDTHVVDNAGIEKISNLFERVNANGENLRTFFDKLLEDLLVLDAAAIEVVRNAKDEIVELYVVDGSTIRPVYNEYGEMDPNKGYVQVIGDKVVATFKANEIIYIMQNPQSSLEGFGYGKSPIESIFLVVQASLNAEMYNAESFSKDNIPPGILDLGDMDSEEAQAFIATWNATTITNQQQMKFVWGGGSEKKYTPLKGNNKDMQFVEYTDWLSRIKLATFGLSSQDANITQDVNRSTSKTQASSSNSRGIRTVKKLFEEFITREIIIPMGHPTLQFKFDTYENTEEKKVQADIDKVYIEAGVYTPLTVARREGFEDPEINSPGEVSDYQDISANPNPEGEISGDVLSAKKHYKPLYK